MECGAWYSTLSAILSHIIIQTDIWNFSLLFSPSIHFAIFALNNFLLNMSHYQNIYFNQKCELEYVFSFREQILRDICTDTDFLVFLESLLFNFFRHCTLIVKFWK